MSPRRRADGASAREPPHEPYSARLASPRPLFLLLGRRYPRGRQHRGTVRAPGSPDYLFNDSHFHLTNYVQNGTNIHRYLEIMGDKIGRSTLFGIPLQQQWSYGNSADFAPTYYLQSDAPLYYTHLRTPTSPAPISRCPSRSRRGSIR